MVADLPTSLGGTGSTYRQLGVRPLLNAAGRYTKFGGSVMPPEVVAAMTEAATTHVHIDELQVKAGARLAQLTRNEDAFVTTGAAAGIVLSILAAAAGRDEGKVMALAEGRASAGRVIVQRAHRIPYLPAIRLAGAEIVEVGPEPVPDSAGAEPVGDAAELAAAITEQTTAILYVAGEHLTRGALSLDQVVAVASARHLPVIVDAAAQLPPLENLWRFTDAGATVALFSGGKDLEGPQASGLMVGQAEFLAAVRMQSSPNQRLARALKTGKEEIVGLVAAVERYCGLDHEARRADWHRCLSQWQQGFQEIAGLTTQVSEINEAGQPIPRLELTWREGPTGDEIAERLLAAPQPIAVAVAGPYSIAVTPETVAPAEEPLVLAGVAEVVRMAIQ